MNVREIPNIRGIINPFWPNVPGTFGHSCYFQEACDLIMSNYCILSHLTTILFSYWYQFCLFCPVSGFKRRLTLFSLHCREIKYFSVKKTERKEHSITVRNLLVREIFIHLKIYMHLEESTSNSRFKKKKILSRAQIEGQWKQCSVPCVDIKYGRTESKN